MRIFYAYSLIQISAACALAYAIYKLGPLCEEQTFDQLKQRMTSSLGDDGHVTMHVTWLFNFTATQQPSASHQKTTTTTRNQGSKGPERIHAKSTTTPPALGDSVVEDTSRVPSKSNLPGKDDIGVPVPASAGAAETKSAVPEKTETKPPVPVKVDSSEGLRGQRVPRDAAKVKAKSTDQHRVEKKDAIAPRPVPSKAFSQYKICVEVVEQESAPEDEPMNKLVSRMNYCFFAMVVAALMGLVHMGLRAANSMPLSEFADCVLLVFCAAGWAFAISLVVIVHYGWSDSWTDLGILPCVPGAFVATEIVGGLVLFMLAFDFLCMNLSYMNVSLRESRPYQRASGGTDHAVYQPTTE